MGDIAASGGYYAAAAAREVYASPLTITGSIGIFTGKFNAASLFDWIGVKSTPVGLGDTTSDIYEPWTENERMRVEADMLYRYQTFLAQIASTRALTAEEFDKVARGHVWLGDAALERRIVDRKGGLLDAIRRAEALAGLSPNEAEYKIYPETGITVSAGIGVTMSRWLGFSVADDVKQVSALDALVRVLKSSEASAVLPLFHRSEEALMLPYDHLVIE
jgi:protease-4